MVFWTREAGSRLLLNKESSGGESLSSEIPFGDITRSNFSLIQIKEKIKKNYVGVLFVD